MSLVSTLPVERVSLDTWSQFHDDRGQIYDEYSLRKWLFYEVGSLIAASLCWKLWQQVPIDLLRERSPKFAVNYGSFCLDITRFHRLKREGREWTQTKSMAGL